MPGATSTTRAARQLPSPSRPGGEMRSPPAQPGGRPLPRVLLLATFAGVLLVACLLSIAVGSRSIPVGDVVRTLLQGDGEWDDAVVNGLRLPRTLVGLAVGGSLALAGALMQGLTRNPLADPGLLGTSAGAAFGVILATGVLGISSVHGYVWFAFAGALIATVTVYALAGVGRGGPTPAKLALAGAAVTALLASLTGAVVLTDVYALNTYRFWSVGSLTGRDAGVLGAIVPFLVVGAVLAVASAPALNQLALGDDIARSLGQRVGVARARVALAVMLLAGGAVAVAGPIVFVGLVVPHVARALTGPDHRWLLPLCAVLGPSLLLLSDVVGRVIARPAEVQVGIVVAFVGAPFFSAVVRRRRLVEL